MVPKIHRLAEITAAVNRYPILFIIFARYKRYDE